MVIWHVFICVNKTGGCCMLQILPIFKKGVKNFLENPIFFSLRQIYRFFVVLPFEAIVSLYALTLPKEQQALAEPKDFYFLITSVIYPVVGRNVTYGTTRSVFNAEDRASQTLKTIESIRRKVPGAKICLIEAGLKQNLPAHISEKVDQYLYLGDKKIVRWACDSRFKSLGEAVMLLCASAHIPKSADFYFKISGRYFLDEDFDIQKWKDGLMLFYFLQHDYVSTRLYGFRKEVFQMWRLALIKGLPFAVIGYAIENTLVSFIPKKYITKIEKIGVTGVSASNTLMKE